MFSQITFGNEIDDGDWVKLPLSSHIVANQEVMAGYTVPLASLYNHFAGFPKKIRVVPDPKSKSEKFLARIKSLQKRNDYKGIFFMLARQNEIPKEKWRPFLKTHVPEALHPDYSKILTQHMNILILRKILESAPRIRQELLIKRQKNLFCSDHLALLCEMYLTHDLKHDDYVLLEHDMRAYLKKRRGKINLLKYSHALPEDFFELLN